MYKSRRIVPQHKKKVWVGRGRCQAAIIPVNTGVPRVRKTSGPRRLSVSFKKSIGIWGLPKVRKTAGPKRIRIRKNYGAGMPVKEIDEMIPNIDDLANFQKKIDAELDDDGFREEVIQNKADARSAQSAMDKVIKQIGATSSEAAKEAALEDLKTELFNKERAQHKLDTGRMSAELSALKRAAVRAQNESPEEYTETLKDIERLVLKKNRIINQGMVAESEIKKINEQEAYKNAVKRTRALEQALEDFKEEEARIAKKLHPFGKVTIAPLASDFGFGKANFGKFW
jgi:hypothetical protein